MIERSFGSVPAGPAGEISREVKNAGRGLDRYTEG